MFIQHISDLQECWGDINEILRDKEPLYVLIDEAHMMPANDPVWMYLKKPHSPVITIAAAECVATVKIAHIFTNEHSFPCLKMADFFVTAECERWMSRCSHLRWRHGGVSDSVTVFTCIRRGVSYRCYHTIAGKTFERPISAWWSDVGMSEAVLDELMRLGLWLREENCLISLLLQQVVLKKRGDAGRRKIENVSYENFGHVLVYALSFLRQMHFQP